MAKLKTVTQVDNGLRIEWGDGEVSVMTLDELPDNIIGDLAIHGLKQKTMDAHAGGLKEHGTIAGCRAESEKVYDALVAGIWSAGRTTSGWILQAIAEVFETTVEEAAARWAELDDETRKAVRADSRIKLWKAQHDAERAADAKPSETVANLF